ncbi:MAG: glycoside hydrolase family 172 protein [Phycisphaerae bacterium]
MLTRALAPACFSLFVAAAAFGQREPINAKTLLYQLTDLAQLAEFPDPRFTCRQFSSYDRASKTPDDEKAWFANGDAGHFLRVEERAGRKEHVMMDAEGPGTVVRIWSANPAGTLRIYLDRSDRPAIEAPMADLLGGRLPGIPTPIAGERSRGWNCYFPFPYARHCKITSDANGFYYHVNYRTYGPETPIITFAPNQLEDLAADTYAIAAQLAFPRNAPGERPLPRTEKFELAPGASSAMDLHGAAAIVELTAKLDADAEDIESTLRHTVLRAQFDGAVTIEAPLGDFFGAAPGLNRYTSLPLGVATDGTLWSHWVMPFEKSARLEFQNYGESAVSLRVSVGTKPYRWTERSMHFHATYHASADVPTRPMIDWNYLRASGPGVLVGAAFAIANPVRQWWGEGDEKIYVDDESFPSHFGTGTEDYFGYAWCSPLLFGHAFHNQPRCDGPGNYGYTAVNRWHILDRIPFEKNIRFDMELWHWREGITVDMAVVTYWYGRPGARDDRPALEAKDLALKALPPYTPRAVAGAQEGEQLAPLGGTGTQPQDIEACSNEQHLWWREVKPGAQLSLGFQAPADGAYRVFVRCVKAKDYGIHQLAINDENAGEPRDFFADRITPADELDLGLFTLKKGVNQLRVTAVGANEKAIKNYMFGLDYIRIEPK